MSTAVCSTLVIMEAVWFYGKRVHVISEREQRHNPRNSSS